MKHKISFILFMTALGIGLLSAIAVSDTSKAAQIKSFRILNKPTEPLVVG